MFGDHVEKFVNKFVDDFIFRQLQMIDNAVRQLIMSNVSPDRITLRHRTDNINIAVDVDGESVFVAAVTQIDLSFIFTGLWIGQWSLLNG